MALFSETLSTLSCSWNGFCSVKMLFLSKRSNFPHHCLSPFTVLWLQAVKTLMMTQTSVEKGQLVLKKKYVSWWSLRFANFIKIFYWKPGSGFSTWSTFNLEAFKILFPRNQKHYESHCESKNSGSRQCLVFHRSSSSATKLWS